MTKHLIYMTHSQITDIINLNESVFLTCFSLLLSNSDFICLFLAVIILKYFCHIAQ